MTTAVDRGAPADAAVAGLSAAFFDMDNTLLRVRERHELACVLLYRSGGATAEMALKAHVWRRLYKDRGVEMEGCCTRWSRICAAQS